MSSPSFFKYITRSIFDYHMMIMNQFIQHQLKVFAVININQKICIRSFPAVIYFLGITCLLKSE
jgi:hypothetical protein